MIKIHKKNLKKKNRLEKRVFNSETPSNFGKINLQL